MGSSPLKNGALNVIMDAQAGSSGKGKLAAYIMDNYQDEWDFCCNAFFPNAGHWVRLTDDEKDHYFYQQLNSCAWMFSPRHRRRFWNKMMFIGPGAIIELPALLKEIKQNGISPRNLKISPLAVILQDKDSAFERGEVDLDGNKAHHSGTMKYGSTCHGVGAANARRVLRSPSLVTANDVDVLTNFVSPDVSDEIMDRIFNGQTGILEIAQGYQLSILHERFFPHTTSRNVTVSQGLSDMFLPPSVIGNVILNYRTFPIRINSNKYVAVSDGHHLTHDELDSGEVEFEEYHGDSGSWYPDQHEITWEELSKDAGSLTSIRELTSVTKLPRRVATFSVDNLIDSISHNLPPIGSGEVFLAINFANYVDADVEGCSSSQKLFDSHKFRHWWYKNIPESLQDKVKFIGTGKYHNQMVVRG